MHDSSLFAGALFVNAAARRARYPWSMALHESLELLLLVFSHERSHTLAIWPRTERGHAGFFDHEGVSADSPITDRMATIAHLWTESGSRSLFRAVPSIAALSPDPPAHSKPPLSSGSDGWERARLPARPSPPPWPRRQSPRLRRCAGNVRGMVSGRLPAGALPPGDGTANSHVQPRSPIG